MRIVSEERDISRIGVEGERHFSIKATGKAFKILSSGLYKDKILAIIRELSCNAYDAHVAAGCPEKPFYVHLPNAMEPFFSVRDEGTGLSHDDLCNVFAVYFETTKANDNNQVGGLGLGCKSPFSYVDSFTVVSRFNGEQRTYTAFISEDGWPVVVQMGPTIFDSSLINGVEVSIPVAPSDIIEFVQRAHTVYSLFDPCPIVTGVSNFAIPEVKVLVEGDWYRILDRNGSARAIMGTVAYPISKASLRNYLSPDLLDLLDLPIDIKFPMGSLEFTAGREELSYDIKGKTTIPSIEKALAEIRNDIPQRLSEHFTNCTTEYEARCLYSEYMRSKSYEATGLFEKCRPKWNGKSISGSFMVTKEHFKTEDQELDVSLVQYYWRSSTRIGRYEFDKGLSHPAMCSGKEMVIFNDLPALRAVARIRHAIMTDSSKTFYLVSGDSDHFETFANNTFPGMPKMLASEMAPAPAADGEARKRAIVRTLRYKDRHPSLAIGSMDRAEVDLEEGGYYVVTRSGHIEKTGWQNAKFCDFVKEMHYHKLLSDVDNIFVVPSSVADKFVDNDLWVDFIDAKLPVARDFLAKSITGDTLRKTAAYSTFTKCIHPSEGSELEQLAKRLPESHCITRFVARVATAREASNNISRFLPLASVIGHEAAMNDNDTLSAEFLKIRKRYRFMFEVLRAVPSYSKIAISEYVEYVKLVDNIASNTEPK